MSAPEAEVRSELESLYALTTRDERRTAQLERKLWGLVKDRLSKPGQRTDKKAWFEEQFGIRGYIVQARSSLLLHDELATPLWASASAGTMTLDTAARAVCHASRQEDPEAFVSSFLRNPKGLNLNPRPKKKRKRRPSKEVDLQRRSRKFYADLRGLIDAFVDERLGDVGDPGLVDKAKEDFEFSVRSAYDTLLRDLRNLQGMSKRHNESIARSKIVRAFGYLGLSCPRVVKQEHIEEAKKMHRKISRDLHPDRNNNDQQIVEQYVEVQQAWDVIKAIQV